MDDNSKERIKQLLNKATPEQREIIQARLQTKNPLKSLVAQAGLNPGVIDDAERGLIPNNPVDILLKLAHSSITKVKENMPESVPLGSTKVPTLPIKVGLSAAEKILPSGTPETMGELGMMGAGLAAGAVAGPVAQLISKASPIPLSPIKNIIPKEIIPRISSMASKGEQLNLARTAFKNLSRPIDGTEIFNNLKQLIEKSSVKSEVKKEIQEIIPTYLEDSVKAKNLSPQQIIDTVESLTDSGFADKLSGQSRGLWSKKVVTPLVDIQKKSGLGKNYVEQFENYGKTWEDFITNFPGVGSGVRILKKVLSPGSGDIFKRGDLGMTTPEAVAAILSASTAIGGFAAINKGLKRTEKKYQVNELHPRPEFMKNVPRAEED